MKKLSLLLSITALFIVSYSQQTQTMIFDYHYCKDALVFKISNKQNDYYKTTLKNQGNRQDIEIMQWTWDGSPGTMASLMFFDVSDIPKKTKIIKATLELHEATKLETRRGIIEYSKSREFRICRVTQKWEEDKVLWNNKPSYTTKDAVIVSDDDDIENIDITKFVQDWVNKPNKNFGIFLEIPQQDYYRGVIFASSENEDIAIRPVLKVTFETNQTIKSAKEDKFSNPQHLQQVNNCNNNQTLIIIDKNLDVLVNISNFSADQFANICSKLEKGNYLVQMIDENQNIVSFKLQK